MTKNDLSLTPHWFCPSTSHCLFWVLSFSIFYSKSSLGVIIPKVMIFVFKFSFLVFSFFSLIFFLKCFLQ